ncbi:MAG: hypothetical protein PHE49_04665 [bacterium]|nr:hypothetical protein [bacterium]
MEKNIFCIFCSIVFGVLKLNASSVRLDGMGGVDIAVEDIESEMSENPAKWLDFNKPALMFNGFYSECEYFDDYNNLIDCFHYRNFFTRKLEGYALYPFRKAVFGLGYTDNLNKYKYWSLGPYNNGAYVEGSFTIASYEFVRGHCPIFCAGIKLKSINIGVMAKLSNAPPSIYNSVTTYYFDSICYRSDTSDFSTSNYSYILGITTSGVPKIYISGSVEYSEYKRLYSKTDDFDNNSYYTKVNLLVRRKITDWLTIGTKTYYRYWYDHWVTPFGVLNNSYWHWSGIPLGIIISPDSQTIIGMDVYDLIKISTDSVRMSYPRIVIGTERLVGQFTFRCGLEACQAYDGWKDYVFDPKVGIGYHLTSKLNLDLTMEPMDWDPWKLALQYKF